MQSAAVTRCTSQVRMIAKEFRSGGQRSVSSRSSSALFGAQIIPATSRRVMHRACKATPTVALFGSTKTAGTLYDYSVKSIDGKNIQLSKFKGKVLLIVNVASQCGFTPQYKEFVELYDKYNRQGLEVIAFPCNQFGSQEPGSNQEIKGFAQKQGAKFPVMAKVDVNGSNAEPLWEFLKKEQGGLLTSDIKWNFTKFLIDRNGKVVKRYGSTTKPLDVENDIKALL